MNTYNNYKENNDPRNRSRRSTTPHLPCLINCRISSLNIAVTNITQSFVMSLKFKRLVALVISKREPRLIQSKKITQQMDQKPSFVLNMTIRDTEIDFINIACWGQENYIYELNEQIQIGSILEIKTPVIKLKDASSTTQASSFTDAFKPWTPSPYELTTNDKSGEIGLLNISDYDYFEALASVPIREHNDYYPLQDIILNEKSINDDHVNLLFAVQKIGAVEEITTKAGKQLKKLELIVFDRTVASFKLTIWDTELMKFCETWVPKQHVIFAVDVKVHYDEYRKTMVSSNTSKTIFILNPNTKEGYELYNYAKNFNIDIDYDSFTRMKDEDIEPLKYTVLELKSHLDKNDLQHDYIELYVFITLFDIDSAPYKNVTIRCNLCNSFLHHVRLICTNEACVQFEEQVESPKCIYNISTQISDHTGTLGYVRFTSKVIENLFELKPFDFIKLNEDKIVALKWKILLERWKILIRSFEVDDNEDTDQNNNNAKPQQHHNLRIIKMEQPF